MNLRIRQTLNKNNTIDLSFLDDDNDDRVSYGNVNDKGVSYGEVNDDDFEDTNIHNNKFKTTMKKRLLEKGDIKNKSDPLAINKRKKNKILSKNNNNYDDSYSEFIVDDTDDNNVVKINNKNKNFLSSNNNIIAPVGKFSILPVLSQVHEINYQFSEPLDSFQYFKEYMPIIHDCNEESMKTIVPHHPGAKIWQESENCNQQPYLLQPQIPSKLADWNYISVNNNNNSSLVAVSSSSQIINKKPIFQNNIIQDSKYNSIQLRQRLCNELKLPIKHYPNWNEVKNLYELLEYVNKAKVLKRMIIIVCSKQNASYWMPKAFHLWAPLYPRLMFAAIDRDIANEGSSEEINKMRLLLLGYNIIEGVIFVSHLPNEPCRAFNGNNISTTDILNSLQCRYLVSCLSGALPLLESRGMRSSIEVNMSNGYQICIDKILFLPLRKQFSFRLENSLTTEFENINSEVPVGGFIINCEHEDDSYGEDKKSINKSLLSSISSISSSSISNSNSSSSIYINKLFGFDIELWPHQIKSLSWMLYKERNETVIQGLFIHKGRINVVPFHNLVMHYRVLVDYSLFGGILCDEIGYGKTAIVIGLIASTIQNTDYNQYKSNQLSDYNNKLIFTNATLIILPSHLLFQWQSEIIKFVSSKLKVILIASINDIPCKDDIINADIVLVSINLFDSDNYKTLYLNYDENQSIQDHIKLLLSKKVITPPVGAYNRVGIYKLSNNDRNKLKDYFYLNAISNILQKGCDKIKYANKKKNSTMGIALEMFQWKRIVIDEIHEYVKIDNDEYNWSTPIKAMTSCYRWGLTGTPNLSDLISIDRLANLLRISLGSSLASITESFIKSSLYSSKRMIKTYPQAIERYVYIKLSNDEIIQYRQLRYENQTAIELGNHETLEKLVQLCCYLQSNNKRDDLHKVDDKMEIKKKKLDSLLSNINEYKQRILIFNENIRKNDQENKIKYIGQREELIDKMNEIELKINIIKKEIDFFNSQIIKLADENNLPECPICMEDMKWTNATILLSCGHLQCLNCVQKLCVELKQCATCRNPLESDSDWKLLTIQDMQKNITLPRSSSPSSSSSSSLITNLVPLIQPPNNEIYLTHGTKISYIIGQIKEILALDPLAKILVYCQWDKLKNVLLEAFKQHGLLCSALQGRPEVLRNVIDLFSQTFITNGKQFINIMLCSLELKAAGLNLQFASHIMFVHPFYSPNEKQANSWEAQAIGRLLRIGQEKQVNIWRFISLDTIDQELLIRKNLNSGWKDHFDI